MTEPLMANKVSKCNQYLNILWNINHEHKANFSALGGFLLPPPPTPPPHEKTHNIITQRLFIQTLPTLQIAKNRHVLYLVSNASYCQFLETNVKVILCVRLASYLDTLQLGVTQTAIFLHFICNMLENNIVSDSRDFPISCKQWRHPPLRLLHPSMF